MPTVADFDKRCIARSALGNSAWALQRSMTHLPSGESEVPIAVSRTQVDDRFPQRRRQLAQTSSWQSETGSFSACAVVEVWLPVHGEKYCTIWRPVVVL